MSSTKNGHIYRALDPNESRLVHLAPGKHNDPIVCTLEYFDTLSPPPYEALSYVWGDAKITAPINVNGHTLQVTTNLEVALRYLRLRKEDRVLWIDAVVVNQLDLAERAQQVGLMADIYSKAASVRIWLGPADADTAVIFNYIRKRRLKNLYSLKVAWDFRGLLLEFWGGQRGSLCGSRRMYHFRKIFLSPQFSGVRYHLRRFIPLAIAALLSLQVARRNWFSRRWCIQELALSENAVIQCQSESAQSIDLQYLFDYSFGHHMRTMILRSSNPKLEPLRDQIIFGSRCKKDPKDTVYGLLAIADVQESSIVVEYAKSDIDVLIDVFNDALHRAKNISLVGVPWAPNIPGLPSWIVPTEDESRCKNEEAFSRGLPEPPIASRIPSEWRTNARLVHRNEDALPPLAFSSYILYADGITLEAYGEPPEFTDDDMLNILNMQIDFSQFEVFTRTAREKSKTTRKPGDRVVGLFGCNHLLVLRPVEAGFILVEVWLGGFWNFVIDKDDFGGLISRMGNALRNNVKEVLRASPTETFAIV